MSSSSWCHRRGPRSEPRLAAGVLLHPACADVVRTALSELVAQLDARDVDAQHPRGDADVVVADLDTDQLGELARQLQVDVRDVGLDTQRQGRARAGDLRGIGADAGGSGVGAPDHRPTQVGCQSGLGRLDALT